MGRSDDLSCESTFFLLNVRGNLELSSIELSAKAAVLCLPLCTSTGAYNNGFVSIPLYRNTMP